MKKARQSGSNFQTMIGGKPCAVRVTSKEMIVRPKFSRRAWRMDLCAIALSVMSLGQRVFAKKD